METSVEAKGGGGYTCPMHPEVRQPGPGSCPKCGMALEPASPVAAAARNEWVCPMHPEIVRDAPGDFFGVLLSPVIAAAAMSFSSVSVVGNALRLRAEGL